MGSFVAWFDDLASARQAADALRETLLLDDVQLISEGEGWRPAIVRARLIRPDVRTATDITARYGGRVVTSGSREAGG